MRRPLAQVCWAVGGVLPALLLLELGTAMAAGGASSQSSSAAQPLEIARARYRQGVEMYQAGRYRMSQVERSDVRDRFLARRPIL